jgi:GNAT superfamily N-acetyltransferase
MQGKIRIENLQESTLEDLIYVCSSKRLGDPIHRQGIELKEQWLRKMLRKYGSCAKVAYHNGRPVAQILYYPEDADAAKAFRRENVLVINCIYNPTPEAQRLGLGTRLLQSVIQDARKRKTCLGNRPCRFMLAKAFNTGEFLPMPEFYKKNGFLATPEGNLLYLPIEGDYEPSPPVGEYKSLPEDRNKALVFYSPTCQFGYQFAKRIEETVKEVAPQIETAVVNEWEKPEESLKRKNSALIVNARPIRTFFMETEKFKEEVKQAMTENP